jgi:hypothetical protein
MDFLQEISEDLASGFCLSPDFQLRLHIKKNFITSPRTAIEEPAG